MCLIREAKTESELILEEDIELVVLLYPKALKQEIRFIGTLISACRLIEHAPEILQCCKFVYHETRHLDYWFVKAVAIYGESLINA